MDNPIEFAHNASIKDLVAFLKKAKKVHPDHNQSKEANEEFKKLYEAYQKLLKQFTEDGEFIHEEFTEKSNTTSYSNFMFFDKDLQYWLTKIFGNSAGKTEGSN